jgi:hypothetical protein
VAGNFSINFLKFGLCIQRNTARFRYTDQSG